MGVQLPALVAEERQAARAPRVLSVTRPLERAPPQFIYDVRGARRGQRPQIRRRQNVSVYERNGPPAISPTRMRSISFAAAQVFGGTRYGKSEPASPAPIAMKTRALRSSTGQPRHRAEEDVVHRRRRDRREQRDRRRDRPRRAHVALGRRALGPHRVALRQREIPAAQEAAPEEADQAGADQPHARASPTASRRRC